MYRIILVIAIQKYSQYIARHENSLVAEYSKVFFFKYLSKDKIKISSNFYLLEKENEPRAQKEIKEIHEIVLS